MNPTAVYSKSGKGVQEASGKTSFLARPDRAVLSGIDGRATLAEVAQKVGRSFDAAFEQVIVKLDRDGFIREVSAGVASAAAPSRPAAPTSKPGPAAKKPMSGGGGLDELDFTSIGGVKPATQRPAAPPPPPSRPAAPPPPPPPPPKEDQSALTRAREEAEARAAAERERLKAEAEAKTRAEMEARLRAEAERKLKEEAEARAKAEADAKIKAAREAALRAAAEAKAKAEAEVQAKLEAERKAREEAERVRREAEEKARREAEELRQRLEEERRAREEAERKAKEEAERVRRELEEERKRLEAERRREEEERAARRKREEEEERRAEEERAARRKRAEEEARDRAEEAQREAQRKLREEQPFGGQVPAAPAAAPKVEAKKDSFADSLLSDLESFTNREDDERKEHEAAERKAKVEAERRAQEEAQRQAEREREEAEQRRREDEERRRRDEEARRAREEEERRAQEEERRRREADEIRRKAEAATAAAMAKEGRAPAGAEEDIPVTEDDLGMDEVRREQAALDKGKPKPEREKKKKKKPVEAEAPVRVARGRKGGRPIVLTLVVLLLIAIGVAHVVPLGTADYERAATEALGRPVKIGSARLWLFTGLELRMQDVRVGDATMSHVKGSPSIGSIFGDRKEFSRLELDNFKLPQAALADAIFAPVRGDNFRVERIVVKKLELPGPAALPKDLQADILLDAKGVMRSATVRGPDGLVAKLAPKASGIEFEVVAAGFPLPIAPQIVLSNFVMKGSATPRGMKVVDWGGTLYNGVISGTADVRWGRSWSIEGVVTVRGINAAVFAPALLSEGTAEGTGKFSMSAPDPSALMEASRVDGTFTINRGALGSFDLARVIQTNGKEAAGRTPFTEMSGQGTYDRGAVALRNVTLGAGLLNAGASADIARNGALSGRIIADVKTASQTLRATLLLGGTVKEPQVRN